MRSFSSIKSRKRHLYEFRGAKATGGGGHYEVSPMEIFTGRTTVVVFGNEKSLIKTAARALHGVHRTQAAPRLPPPARGSLKEKLSCQRERHREARRVFPIPPAGFEPATLGLEVRSGAYSALQGFDVSPAIKRFPAPQPRSDLQSFADLVLPRCCPERPD